ncbi:ras-related and estrogen-regulated growth inhibitor-like [Babylonia areolata]|uniref:ras-related and estrogen-regulated growth inhibitor-like n=1 Tax=Babylonia areolata TaxID=304850 RepID=UPI003FD47241
MSSPTLPTRALLRKIQSFNKNRVFRVVVLGQKGVGKSALTVRFLTRRFIGDYDSSLEKTYTCTRCIMGSSVDFVILDTAGQYENSRLKQHIKWSDAAVLMYSVTDRCSLNEVRRLYFTITTSCRRRYKPATSDPGQEFPPAAQHPLSSFPVSLVATHTDREPDRMVSREEGAALSRELGCVAFTELSVREDVDSVMGVFQDLFLTAQQLRKTHQHHRSSSKVRSSLGAVSHRGSSLIVSLEQQRLAAARAGGSLGAGGEGGGVTQSVDDLDASSD